MLTAFHRPPAATALPFGRHYGMCRQRPAHSIFSGAMSTEDQQIKARIQAAKYVPSNQIAFLLSLTWSVGRLGQCLSDCQLDAVCALIFRVCCGLFFLSLACLLCGVPVSLSLCLSVSRSPSRSLSFPFLVAPLSRSPGMQTMTPH